jgi:K+-sensing histidine kinase KdpD
MRDQWVKGLAASSMPLLVSMIALGFTTAVLLTVDATFQSNHLLIAYLLPVALIAMHYGSVIGFFAATVSGVAAIYFLLPPKYDLHIDDPLHMAELGFFTLLALIAVKITSLLMDRR